jgi:hypothetical protein
MFQKSIILHQISLATVLLVTYNCSIGNLMNYNMLDQLLPSYLVKIVFGIAMVAALVLSLDRSSWLPFLGESILPCKLLAEQSPADATNTIKVQIEPNTKIVYWAAEPKSEASQKETEEVWKAYDQYDNSGVAVSDDAGIVEIKFKYPQGYYVDRKIGKKVLSPHVHYRVCRDGIILGPVITISV